MLIEIRNYRGIDRADIPLSSKVTLIVGDNHQGKTSFIEGVQAACTAEPNHFKLTKADAIGYVKEGAKEGTVTVKDPHGTRRVTYPSMEVKSLDGAAEIHRRVSMGMVKFAPMCETPAILAQHLEVYASQQVDRKRLSDELDEIKIPQNDRDKILDTVFGNGKVPGMGWDSGEKWAGTEATKRKTLFQQVAGCKWGPNQGITFTPNGWELDLVEAKLEDLEKALTDAREDHDKAIRENAIAESEIDQLKADADEIKDLESEWHQAGLAYEKSSRQVQDLEKKLSKAKADSHLVTCGNCGIKGTVEKETLVAKNNVVLLNSTELADLEREVAEAKKVSDADRQATFELQSRVNKAKAAAEKLKSTEGLQIGAVDPDAIDNAKAAIARAELRLKAFKSKKQGVAYHHQIVALLKASELMSSDGLRKQVLIANLKPFNDKLAEVCRVAGWGTVAIDPSLQLRWDGRHWKLISESQLFMTEITMQIAISLLEAAPLVVIDRANLLERDDLNKLFNCLRDLKIRALVAMSASRDKQGQPIGVPDLGKQGRGCTYWVERNTIIPYAEKLAEAAPAAV